MSIEHASAYRAAHDRIAELTRLGPEAAVPATPGWTVHDLVAHLTGLAAAWVTGDLAGYASAGWTARQVADRASRTLDDVLAEWSGHLDGIEVILIDPEGAGLPEPLMTAFGPVAAAAWPDIIVTDLVLHEHDIRAALGRPGARNSDAVMIAMRSHVGLLRFVGSANGLPPLLLRAGDARDFAVGRGEPEVVLKASLFELLRATGGRRSLDQLRGMDWSPAPGPWLDHIVMPSYGLPDADQVE